MTEDPLIGRPPTRNEAIAGWIALAISILVAGLWAFWGTLECFHEGWWAPTLGGRLLQALAYHTPLAITLLLLTLAIRWPRFGAVLYFGSGAIFSVFIFRERWGQLDLAAVLSWLPVTVLVIAVGVLWWFGRPRPLKLAFLLGLGLPLLVSLACAVEPVWRIAHRVDDGIRTARLVEGNEVSLVWAPAGPGWVRDTRHSADWHEAVEICAHLSADGTAICDEPQHIWRLPTVDEAVRSLTRGGKNAGGVWDKETGRATYRVQPDKESPLWDSYAETIYWWTATEADADHAWRIVYNGSCWQLPKELGMGSQGFRAVRDPEPPAPVDTDISSAKNTDPGSPLAAGIADNLD